MKQKVQKIIDCGFYVRNENEMEEKIPTNIRANTLTIIRVINFNDKLIAVRVMGEKQDQFYNTSKFGHGSSDANRSKISKEALEKYYTPLEDVLNSQGTIWHNIDFARNSSYIGANYVPNLMKGEMICEFANKNVLLYNPETNAFFIDNSSRNPLNVYHRMNTVVTDGKIHWDTERVLTQLSARKLPFYFEELKENSIDHTLTF